MRGGARVRRAQQAALGVEAVAEYRREAREKQKGPRVATIGDIRDRGKISGPARRKARLVALHRARDKALTARRSQRVAVEIPEMVHLPHAEAQRIINPDAARVSQLNTKNATHAKTLKGALGLDMRLRQYAHMSYLFNPRLLKRIDPEVMYDLQKTLRGLIDTCVHILLGDQVPRFADYAAEAFGHAKLTSQEASRVKKAKPSEDAPAWLLYLAGQAPTSQLIQAFRSAYWGQSQEFPLRQRIAAYGATLGRLAFTDLGQLAERLQAPDFSTLDRRAAAARRILLLIAGIEPNPGPAAAGIAFVDAMELLADHLQKDHTGVAAKAGQSGDEDAIIFNTDLKCARCLELLNAIEWDDVAEHNLAIMAMQKTCEKKHLDFVSTLVNWGKNRVSKGPLFHPSQSAAADHKKLTIVRVSDPDQAMQVEEVIGPKEPQQKSDVAAAPQKNEVPEPKAQPASKEAGQSPDPAIKSEIKTETKSQGAQANSAPQAADPVKEQPRETGSPAKPAVSSSAKGVDEQAGKSSESPAQDKEKSTRASAKPENAGKVAPVQEAKEKTSQPSKSNGKAAASPAPAAGKKGGGDQNPHSRGQAQNGKAQSKRPDHVKVIRPTAQKLVADSVKQSEQEMKGELDALREKLKESQEAQVEYKELKDDALADLGVALDQLEEARKQGFDLNPSMPLRVWAFHGRFEHGGRSTYDTDKDPLVNVEMYADGRWLSDAFGPVHEVRITEAQLKVALTSQRTDDGNLRYRNIYNGFLQNKECREEVAKLSEPGDIFDEMVSLELKAFLLAGTVHAAGRIRWMNDCEEWVPHKIELECSPEEWERCRKAGFTFSAQTLKFQASSARDSRAAPIKLDGFDQDIPDKAHMPTLVKGIAKRLVPKIPGRAPEVDQELRRLADDLAGIIMRNCESPEFAAHADYQALKLKALEGRPRYERELVESGMKMWDDDPQAATEHYLGFPYKCFIKMESYQKGAMKPPRFIMSLDPVARGIQIAAMAPILAKIEFGTRICNVKGLTADQITEKLARKFSGLDLVAETDFSSFESCISHELKALIENNIFSQLAEGQDDYRTEFIQRALCRRTVQLIGPCFVNSKFHHIRMSGDYWTSLGNLITNIVLIAYCAEMTIAETMAVGLFEGDDGAFPAPRNTKRVEERAYKAGVLLKLDVAHWTALSFCGNHFVEVDGILYRCRDKYKAMANMTILFNAPRDSTRHDRMLQRSKALAYLYGPIIPDAFVLAALIERFTRDARVDERRIARMGLLKAYSNHALEGCVPEWLDIADDADFAKEVFQRNRAAGGECCLQTILDACKKLREAGPGAPSVFIPSPVPMHERTSWDARDGSKFTHLRRCCGVVVGVSWNDVMHFQSPGAEVPLPRIRLIKPVREQTSDRGFSKTAHLVDLDHYFWVKTFVAMSLRFLAVGIPLAILSVLYLLYVAPLFYTYPAPPPTTPAPWLHQCAAVNNFVFPEPTLSSLDLVRKLSWDYNRSVVDFASWQSQYPERDLQFTLLHLAEGCHFVRALVTSPFTVLAALNRGDYGYWARCITWILEIEPALAWTLACLLGLIPDWSPFSVFRLIGFVLTAPISISGWLVRVVVSLCRFHWTLTWPLRMTAYYLLRPRWWKFFLYLFLTLTYFCLVHFAVIPGVSFVLAQWYASCRYLTQAFAFFGLERVDWMRVAMHLERFAHHLAL